MRDSTKNSEFGKGLVYCLALFLCHTEREDMKGLPIGPITNESLWFNGASDHLYELVVPNDFEGTLKDRLRLFRDNCLQWGHGHDINNPPTKEDKNWAIIEAKELLVEIDKLLGVEVIPADFS